MSGAGPTGPSPDVTVVVVTWQGAHLLPAALTSLRAQTEPHRVVVVDNASSDGTDEVLRGFPEVQVVRLPTNTGFAGGVAAALPVVATRFLALLNNDAWAEPTWLAHALEPLRRDPAVASVSSRMLLTGPDDEHPDDEHPDGEHPGSEHPGSTGAVVNNAGILLRADGYGADRGLGEPDGAPYDVAVEVFGASGGAAVLRTLAVQAVGGVDARYAMYYEDTDLAWRLRLAGWRHVYAPAALVHHRHAATSVPGSARFVLQTERNRLLTLLRCAPLPVLLTALARYALTTASITRSRLLRRELPASAVFDPRVRLRALLSFAGLAGPLARVRRESDRRTRAAVWRRWAGVPARSLADGRPLP